MTQSQPARGADVEEPRRIPGLCATSPAGSRDRMGPTARDLHDPTRDLTVSALDRLIARIETGTATPEDVDGLPEGIVEYLFAALTLDEMGVSAADWEVTPTGGITVRATAR